MSLRLSLRTARRTFAEPARNAHQHWPERSSGIITLQGDSARGEGEASPLPNFSPDTLAACEQALAELDPRSLPERLDGSEAAVTQLARASRALPSELPAARAALECALLALWSETARVPAWSLLTQNAEPKARPLCALISAEPEQWLAQALAARARGLSACKLKVGRAGAEGRELAALGALRRELGPSFTLRLDANRAWSLDEARRSLPAFAAFAPELIEEPCLASAELGSVVPLALDESLLTLTPAELRARPRPGLRALILKPTILGGISACFAWAEVARELRLEVIVSHAFEGPRGLALSAALALSIGSAECAHGLDLEGARLQSQALPYFAQGEVRAWLEPGFGSMGEEP